VAALQSIVSPIARTCVFQLGSPSPDPTNIAVKIGDAKAPRDPGHGDGWDHTDDSQGRIEVYGSWCDRVTGERTWCRWSMAARASSFREPAHGR